MGHIRTTEQPGGLVDVEITYGGKESPFGGIDTSAPPAYIDSKCFTASDGIFISNNQLVASAFRSMNIPILFNSVAGVNLLKIGTFYNSIYGYINYAFGVIYTPTSAGITYTFYLTAWVTSNNTNTIIGNDTYTFTLYNTTQEATNASITLPILQGESSDFTDSGHTTLAFYNSGILLGTVSVAYAPGDTVASIMTAMVTAINAATLTILCTATTTVDGYSIIITANTAGISGNNLAILDASTSSTVGDNPAFFFPAGFTVLNPTNLQNGKDAISLTPPASFSNISTTDVGGTLYLANLGPIIMKYMGPGTLAISTGYAGVKVIKKFEGSLIGLGTIPQLGNVVQDADMVFSWSSAENLDIWSPISTAGNVTGAGFEQLADIGDKLTGLIVSNNTAFIIRDQGISYATATGSGSLPFSVAHVGLGEEGEGAQNPNLICQYNETGAYVGNSSVFKVSGQVQDIGQKINSLLVPAAQLASVTNTVPISATACMVLVGKQPSVIAVFIAGDTLFLYNTNNNTWVTYSAPTIPLGSIVSLTVLSNYVTIDKIIRQGLLSLIIFNPSTHVTTVYKLQEGILSTSPIASVTFPQEELLFGRDVTINSLYISLVAQVNPGIICEIQFYLNETLFSSITLNPAVWNSINGNPIEVQVYPNTMNVFTAHSPQLNIQMTSSVGSNSLIRIAKIQMYATFEPAQKPVS